MSVSYSVVLYKCWVSVTQPRLFSSDVDAKDTKECKTPVEEGHGVRYQQTLVRHAKHRYEDAGSRVG